jgi:hypothetical protein
MSPTGMLRSSILLVLRGDSDLGIGELLERREAPVAFALG